MTCEMKHLQHNPAADRIVSLPRGSVYCTDRSLISGALELDKISVWRRLEK
uniref:Uncharacterized protein n=1 Tax=Anguilla anguilla TaxID=7936 RepID=A0A0E9UM06_ANGAN